MVTRLNWNSDDFDRSIVSANSDIVYVEPEPKIKQCAGKTKRHGRLNFVNFNVWLFILH